MRKKVTVVAIASFAATVAAGVALWRQWKHRKQQQLRITRNILRKFARECATPVPKLWRVADDMVSNIKSSLTSKETTTTTLDMLVSYVASLPSGQEEGFFFGVNLRPTDFLMVSARLGGKNKPISNLHREDISIPTHLTHATSKELFDFIALELLKFVSSFPQIENGAAAKETTLGFTLSYPVHEAAVSTGSAIKWNRFSADDPIGKEMVDDFNRSLENHGLKMRVFAMVDDTIGNLAGGRYYNNKDSVVAVTIGMSTNAAYVESAQEVPNWQGPSPFSEDMVINTEWGNFISSHFPMTEFDGCLDAESSSPGNRIFEKLISGTYLGEIVRQILLKMAQNGALFGDRIPPRLMTPYLLRSPDMAAMHQDASEDREVVSEKLSEIFGIMDSSQTAREIVAEVCDIVTERGARLAGAGILGVIKKLGRIENKRSVVTVEGGLYEHYRIFRNYLHSSIWEMLGNDLSDNVIIEHSHGGSGTGAVFLAASQSQEH